MYCLLKLRFLYYLINIYIFQSNKNTIILYNLIIIYNKIFIDFYF